MLCLGVDQRCADVCVITPSCLQFQNALCQGRVRGQWHGAAASHGTAHTALGIHTDRGGQVIEIGQGVRKLGFVRSDFNANGTLSGGWQELIGGKERLNSGLQTKPVQSGCGQHDARILAFIEFFQPGIKIAAQGFDVEIGAQGLEQNGASQTGCANSGALRQLRKALIVRGDPRIARVLTGQDADQLKALR